MSEGAQQESAERPFAELVASLRWSDIGATVASVRPIQERKDSAIAEATIVGRDGKRRDCIVKRHRVASRDGRPAAELARHEFQTLAFLGRSLADASDGAILYTTPAPLLLDENLCVVVMERAAGVSLDRQIRDARRRGRSRTLAEPLRRAAAWLRLMQRQTERHADGRAMLDRIVGAACEAVRSAGELDATVKTNEAAIVGRLRELAGNVSPSSLRVTGHHGDFWPGNVFVDGERVEVIDFEGFRDGLPLQDVVYLLSYLEQLPLGIIDGRLLQRMFLEPYLAGSSLDGGAMQLFRLVRAIEAVAWRETERRTGLRRLLMRSPQSVIGEIVA